MGMTQWSKSNRICLLFLFILSGCSNPQKSNIIIENSEKPENMVLVTNSIVDILVPTEVTRSPLSTLIVTNEPEKTEQNQPVWIDFTNANYIRALLMDQQGNLWSGGSGGVVRWDTTSDVYTKFTVDQGLRGNFVTDIAETVDGSVWFSTCLGGVTRYDGKTWTTFTTEDGLFSNCVMSLTITTDGMVWAGSLDGLNRFDGEFWTTFPVLPSLESSIIRVDVIAEAPDGDLWIGALGDHSLMRFDGENCIDYSNFLPEPSVMAIAFSPDGTMWVGGEGYLTSYKNSIWQTHPDAFIGDRDVGIGVSSIAVSDEETVWVGFTQSSDENSFGFRENMVDVEERFHGVSKFENGIWTSLDQENGLAQNEVTSILVNSDGSVWFGTYKHGISRLTEKGWHTFVTKDEIPTNAINDLQVISSNEIWITYPDGVSNYDGKTWQALEESEINQGNKVDQILSTSDGALWLNTIDGLFRYKDQLLIDYPGMSENKFYTIYSIIMDDKARYLFVTSYGVYQLDEFGWRQPNFLSESGDITDLVIALNGDIWVSTCDEIYVFHDDKLKDQYKKRDGVLVGCDNKLIVDLVNAIWVGSSEGISRFDGEQWISYKKGDGVIGSIHDMELDSNGNIWVLTDSGLFSFDGVEWVDHHLNRYFYELEIDENGTVWLGLETLTKYTPNE
jgi:ligand-binding sensor domain-containing protein